MKQEGLYLGGVLDRPGGEVTAPWWYGPDNLTTHGLIVGMTGSGKTGLALVLLEELLNARIPLIVLDPKGDLGNLCLQFPELEPSSFKPWIVEPDVLRQGTTVEAEAVRLAGKWREGLAKWNIPPARHARLKEQVEYRIFTPGSDAGLPVNILQIFSPEPGDSADARRDALMGAVSSLLGLIGVEADPVQSPEHILLSNILDHFWNQNIGPGLEEIILAVQHPPMKKLGIFPVDELYPPAQRKKLAIQLNALLASPAFTQLRQGWPLDMDRLLEIREDRTPCNIFYLSHLKDEERMFMISAILNRLLAWTRRQPGTGSLRCALYFDEIAGYCPPHPVNPPAKAPLLTLLKQARAFGTGILLATQNPVDVDYKAMTNMGTWFVGKLQSEGDKNRLLDGLTLASGAGPDRQEAGQIISGLAPRQFFLKNVHAARTEVVTTRWAMSYLAGPMSLPNIVMLREKGMVLNDAAAPGAPSPLRAVPASPVPDQPPPVPGSPALQAEPELFPEWSRIYLPPGSRHYQELMRLFPGFAPPATGTFRYYPFLLARVKTLFDEERDQFFLDKYFWRLAGPLHEQDVRSWENPAEDWGNVPGGNAPVAGASFSGLAPALLRKDPAAAMQKAILEDIFREEAVELFRHHELRLASRPGETRPAFEARCRSLAEDQADGQVRDLRRRYESKLEGLRSRLQRTQLDLANARGQHSSRQQEELISAGETILGLFFGSRSRRSFSGAMNKRRQTASAGQRVESRELQVQELQEEIGNLQQDLEQEIRQIEIGVEQLAGAVVASPVRLEKTDIQVLDFTLVWVPGR